MNELELVEKRDLREELVERVEVLEKVKQLLLIPNTTVANMQQIADYYEVDRETIKMTIRNHIEEFKEDGILHLTGAETRNYLIDNKNKIENNRGYFVIQSNIKFANRSNVLLPLKSILRIGMLLRDSVVAKEVRNQLLNIHFKHKSIKNKKNNEAYLLGNKSIYVALFDNDTVKIGVSENVEHRLKTIEVSQNIKLKNYYYTDKCSNAFSIEKQSHNYFKMNNIYGEFFDIEFEKAVEKVKEIFNEQKIMNYGNINDAKTKVDLLFSKNKHNINQNILFKVLKCDNPKLIYRVILYQMSDEITNIKFTENIEFLYNLRTMFEYTISIANSNRIINKYSKMLKESEVL